jgi:hypothetical protein
MSGDDGRPNWNHQFAESYDERRERWRRIKARRKAEGRCWQCAEPVAECHCALSKENFHVC